MMDLIETNTKLSGFCASVLFLGVGLETIKFYLLE